jgi:hypothetical protein
MNPANIIIMIHQLLSFYGIFLIDALLIILTVI